MKIPQKLIRDNIIDIWLNLSDREFDKYKEFGLNKTNIFSLDQTQRDNYISYLGYGNTDSNLFRSNGINFKVNMPSPSKIIYTILNIKIKNVEYRVKNHSLKLKYEYEYETKSEKNSTFFKWVRELVKEGLLNFNNANHLQTQQQAEKEDQQQFHHQSQQVELPIPIYKSRSSEFNKYEVSRNSIFYEYLFNSRSHRWLDKNILKLNDGKSLGYQSMSILHFKGVTKDFKGLFQGLNVNEALEILVVADVILYKQLIETLMKIQKQDFMDLNIQVNKTIDEGKEYPEGRIAYVLHRKIERKPQLIKDAKELFIKKNGRLYCEACGFDFLEKYGERGSEFIEGHHKKLVSEMKVGEKTKIEDIAMLCSNCHRMIHKKPLLSVAKLADMILRYSMPSEEDKQKAVDNI
ncbi:HNH endonuclease [Paenibacillus glacialis]|uniref:HNH domain-containing protein n=1 Tax=Paenibacillus glacialis TaxID=494026 RepID=A0A168M3H3_9BACL|nr:HNH endonuclease [Paenibacillus glacialis]OAB44172.1 hypothetical protein PGLA_05735 [Paenibacillus glacialis]